MPNSRRARRAQSRPAANSLTRPAEARATQANSSGVSAAALAHPRNSAATIPDGNKPCSESASCASAGGELMRESIREGRRV